MAIRSRRRRARNLKRRRPRFSPFGPRPRAEAEPHPGAPEAAAFEALVGPTPEPAFLDSRPAPCPNS